MQSTRKELGGEEPGSIKRLGLPAVRFEYGNSIEDFDSVSVNGKGRTNMEGVRNFKWLYSNKKRLRVRLLVIFHGYVRVLSTIVMPMLMHMQNPDLLRFMTYYCMSEVNYM